MTRLNPYLSFNGNCREAMQFYQACLGGDLKIMSVAESPMAASMPAAMQKQVMHALLEKPDMVLMASDTMGRDVKAGDNVSLCLNGSDAAEIKQYYNRLSAGGHVNRPIKEEFFGLYGEILDKFGIHWMFMSEPQRK
jgi:PhnB protein